MGERRLSLSLFVIISAITIALCVLAYTGYRSAAQLAARSARSVGTSNRLLGRKLIDRIEKVIIDNDRTFFNLVNLEDPKEFRELWRRIVRVSGAVESVVVLDGDLVLKHFITKLRVDKRRAFKAVLMQRLVPQMQLAKLPRDAHKHLHTTYRGTTYLLSYIRRKSYAIVLAVNIPYILREVFPSEFGSLGTSQSIAVMDEAGRVLYGRPVATHRSRLVFEDRFPTTLYKWRLQIAPEDMGALRREARRRGVVDLVLVAVAVSVIIVGLLVMFAAVRKERRANALKSEFIANVSHELKTPLSLIRMFGELLALGRASKVETQREYAEIITRESDRLTSLIDNVLDFARIERGKVAYEFLRGDLRLPVEKAIELSSYRYEQAGVTLRVDIADEIPHADFDGSAMTLVVLNLLENALKYGATKDGEVRVSLRARGGGAAGADDRAEHGDAEGDAALLISVSDDGPGIPEDEQRRIFERFFRGRNAEPALATDAGDAPVRRAAPRGSGIGLSLVKHIAQAHGGSVRVDSELGKGATFEVSIPSV